MGLFRIGCLQLDIGNGDNFNAIAAEMRAAKSVFANIDMMVIGELATYGVDTGRAEPMPGPTEKRYCDLAKQLGVWLIPGSLFEKAGNKIYNTAPVINSNGAVVARYRKMFPWYPFESHTSAGDQFVTFDVPDAGRFGVSICYDSSFPEVPRGLAWMGAEVIINVTATYTHDRPIENVMTQAHAYANHCYVVDVCNTGYLGNGRSVIAGPDGDLIYKASAKRELIPVAIDFNRARLARSEGNLGLSPHLENLARSKVRFPQFGNRRISPPADQVEDPAGSPKRSRNRLKANQPARKETGSQD